MFSVGKSNLAKGDEGSMEPHLERLDALSEVIDAKLTSIERDFNIRTSQLQPGSEASDSRVVLSPPQAEHSDDCMVEQVLRWNLELKGMEDALLVTLDDVPNLAATLPEHTRAPSSSGNVSQVENIPNKPATHSYGRGAVLSGWRALLGRHNALLDSPRTIASCSAAYAMLARLQTVRRKFYHRFSGHDRCSAGRLHAATQRACPVESQARMSTADCIRATFDVEQHYLRCALALQQLQLLNTTAYEEGRATAPSDSDAEEERSSGEAQSQRKGSPASAAGTASGLPARSPQGSDRPLENPPGLLEGNAGMQEIDAPHNADEDPSPVFASSSCQQLPTSRTPPIVALAEESSAREVNPTKAWTDARLIQLSLSSAIAAASSGQTILAANYFAMIVQLLVRKGKLVEELVRDAVEAPPELGPSRRPLKRPSSLTPGGAASFECSWNPFKDTLALDQSLSEEGEREKESPSHESTNPPDEAGAHHASFAGEEDPRGGLRVPKWLWRVLKRVDLNALSPNFVEPGETPSSEGGASIDHLMPTLKSSKTWGLAASRAADARAGRAPAGSSPPSGGGGPFALLVASLAWNTAYMLWDSGYFADAYHWLCVVDLRGLIREICGRDAAGAMTSAQVSAARWESLLRVEAKRRGRWEGAGEAAGEAGAPPSAAAPFSTPVTSSMMFPHDNHAARRPIPGSSAFPPEGSSTPAPRPQGSGSTSTNRMAWKLLTNIISLRDLCEILFFCEHPDDVVALIHQMARAQHMLVEKHREMLAALAQEREAPACEPTAAHGLNEADTFMADIILILNIAVESFLSRRSREIYHKTEKGRTSGDSGDPLSTSRQQDLTKPTEAIEASEAPVDAKAEIVGQLPSILDIPRWSDIPCNPESGEDREAEAVLIACDELTHVLTRSTTRLAEMTPAFPPDLFSTLTSNILSATFNFSSLFHASKIYQSVCVAEQWVGADRLQRTPPKGHRSTQGARSTTGAVSHLASERSGGISGPDGVPSLTQKPDGDSFIELIAESERGGAQAVREGKNGGGGDAGGAQPPPFSSFTDFSMGTAKRTSWLRLDDEEVSRRLLTIVARYSSFHSLKTVRAATLDFVVHELNMAKRLLVCELRRRLGAGWWARWRQEKETEIRGFYVATMNSLQQANRMHLPLARCTAPPVVASAKISSVDWRQSSAAFLSTTATQGLAAASGIQRQLSEWWSRPLNLFTVPELKKKKTLILEREDHDLSTARLKAQQAANSPRTPSLEKPPCADAIVWDALVFIPEVAVDFSGFTTSSLEAYIATQRVVSTRMEALEGVSILSSAGRHLLHDQMPMLQQYRDWRLVYSTTLHGVSLQTMLAACEQEADAGEAGFPAAAAPSRPMLLVLELFPSTDLDFSEESAGVRAAAAEAPARPLNRLIIGAYLSDMLKRDSRRYYGSSETFVFQLLEEGGKGKEKGAGEAPTPQLRTFHAQGRNAQYINCRADAVAIGGGGGVSLYLDDRVVHGATGGCPTFGAPPLTAWAADDGPEPGAAPSAQTKGFDIRRLEVLVMT